MKTNNYYTFKNKTVIYKDKFIFLTFCIFYKINNKQKEKCINSICYMTHIAILTYNFS